MFHAVRHTKFHGRHDGAARYCAAPGCTEAGEFRAPGGRPSGADGPGDYRWFCLDHVRQFNSAYDFFDGMSSDEIFAAQSPLGGWDTETRAFRPTAGVDEPPRWADFADPLEAIGARARAYVRERRRMNEVREDGVALSFDQRRALETLGLPLDADRRALRRRYSDLVRRYHPDRNGGDRSQEEHLRQVVEAYQSLRKAAAFA